MDLDHVVIQFLTCAAVGAASVLLVILFVGFGMPGHTPVTIRRIPR